MEDNGGTGEEEEEEEEGGMKWKVGCGSGGCVVVASH